MPDPGQLTTYLGTAPGVGKTYAMLTEARRRAASGARVVIGWLQPQERPDTVAQISDLEMIAPIDVTYRGRQFAELDTQAILAAHPDVVVVDELAHSWPDRSRSRWMDVADLLAAGVDTLGSLNVANLVSARDYVARVTGAGAVESVPDELVRAGQVVLVDMPADALRARLTSGRVFSVDQVGGALSEYFRVANLEALSALGRAWMEDNIEAAGDALLADRGLAPLSPRSVVMAGVSDSPWGEPVIIRAARMACDDDADLLVVHARVHDGTGRPHPEVLDYYRQLTEGLGGSFVEAEGDTAARVLADEAAERSVSAVVVARHRSTFSEVFRGSVARRLRRLSPDLPVVEVRQQATLSNPGE
ncbi:MAG TPA: universal stress protein [Acidimicrobiales bacterium]|nr:universal stress protein [Acidimicrobiales bacterium]